MISGTKCFFHKEERFLVYKSSRITYSGEKNDEPTEHGTCIESGDLDCFTHLIFVREPDDQEDEITLCSILSDAKAAERARVRAIMDRTNAGALLLAFIESASMYQEVRLSPSVHAELTSNGRSIIDNYMTRALRCPASCHIEHDTFVLLFKKEYRRRDLSYERCNNACAVLQWAFCAFFCICIVWFVLIVALDLSEAINIFFRLFAGVGAASLVVLSCYCCRTIQDPAVLQRLSEISFTVEEEI